MPVAQGINGTIIESTQTGLQRDAFNENNPDGQRVTLSSIFSSSPIHGGTALNERLLNTQGNSDRSGLFNGLEGADQVEIMRKAYAKLLSSTDLNGFGFEGNNKVNLDFSNDDVVFSNPEDLSENVSGVVKPQSELSDNPNLGHANLFTHADLNNPSNANTKQIAGNKNINFGSPITEPSTDTLGQFFNNVVNGEEA